MPPTDEVSSINEDALLPPVERPLLAMVPLTPAAPEAPTEATDAANVDPTATAILAATITPIVEVREVLTLGVVFVDDRQVGNAGKVLCDGSYSAAAGRPAAQNCLFIESIPGIWKATCSEVILTSTLRIFSELRRASSALQCTVIFVMSTCRASDLFVDEAAALSIASVKMICTDLLRSSGDIGISSTRCKEILFVCIGVVMGTGVLLSKASSEDVGAGVVDVIDDPAVTVLLVNTVRADVVGVLLEDVSAGVVDVIDDPAVTVLLVNTVRADVVGVLLEDVGAGVVDVIDDPAVTVLLVNTVRADVVGVLLEDVGAGVVVEVGPKMEVVVLDPVGLQVLLLVAAVTVECLPASHSEHGSDPFTALYFPDTHSTQIDPSGPVYPALHLQFETLLLKGNELDANGQAVHMLLDGKNFGW